MYGFQHGKRVIQDHTCHDNSESINEVSDPSPGVLSQDRVEATAESHRKTESVSSKSHADRDNQIGCPTSDGPVIDGKVDGIHVNFVLRVVTRLSKPCDAWYGEKDTK